MESPNVEAKSDAAKPVAPAAVAAATVEIDDTDMASRMLQWQSKVEERCKNDLRAEVCVVHTNKYAARYLIFNARPSMYCAVACLAVIISHFTRMDGRKEAYPIWLD